jgi:hypothetical protein
MFRLRRAMFLGLIENHVVKEVTVDISKNEVIILLVPFTRIWMRNWSQIFARSFDPTDSLTIWDVYVIFIINTLFVFQLKTAGLRAITGPLSHVGNVYSLDLSDNGKFWVAVL